eukprot:scaffold224950_cov17-Tisochrysis_lutea.AAC.1
MLLSTTSPPHIMRDLMQAAMPEAAAKLQLALTRGASPIGAVCACVSKAAAVAMPRGRHLGANEVNV